MATERFDRSNMDGEELSVKKHFLRSVGRRAAIVAALCAGLGIAPAAEACTGIMLRTADGSVVHGRTVEFGIPIDLDIAFIPRGYAFEGKTPLGAGKAWTAKYAAIGGIAFGNLALVDGMNEKGLAAGAFYFPTFAEYTETTPENQAKSMSMSDFANWILTSFASVAEVRAAIEKGEVAIAPTVLPGWPAEPQPFHYVVYDKTGTSIVIEPIDGTLKMYDNPLGVVTNSPPFDWHMTNLRNYIALDPVNVPAITIDKTSFKPLGQGSGMLGLPGDFTPPSRFVRAAVFSSTALPSETSQEGVYQTFHILNNFDIPKGVARTVADGKVHADYTMLTAARDPQTLTYYWHTYDDQTIRSVDMTRFDFDGDKVLTLSTKSTQPVIDMSAEVNER